MQRPFLIPLGQLAVVLILVSGIAHSQSSKTPRATPPTAGDVTGRLETRDGQKILYLWGSPEERGYAEGFLMAQVILTTFEEYCLSPQMMPNPQLWNLVALPMVKARVDISDRLRERAEGLAEGLRQALGEEKSRSEKLGRHLTADDFVGVTALIDWIGQFCSSYVSHGPLLQESRGPLVGRNLDYPGSPTMTENTLIKVEAPDEDAGTHGWISFGWAGMLGCVTGYSEAGVTVAIHDVPAKAPDGRVRPRVDLLSQLIETLEPGAIIAEEARLITRQSNYAMGANFMLGWADEEHRGGAVLEVRPNAKEEDGVQIRSAGDTFVVCTNHHRVDIENPSCDRYSKLCQTCDAIVADEVPPLDFESGWLLIKKASVGFTLYRLLIDLESDAFRFQYRVKPFGDWAEARDFDARSLRDACREMIADAK